MKQLLLCLFLFVTYSPVARTEALPLATIKSIDNLDLEPAWNDASEVCLPFETKALDNYTVISDGQARDLFNLLTKDPKARNRVAGGKCAIRRSYIQRYLKQIGISSGSLYVECPAKNGRMRLIDQVTNHRYTFANFHDANVLSVKGIGLQVFDVQFKSAPETLSTYLAQIEASQKLKPLKDRTRGEKGFCYWSIR